MKVACITPDRKRDYLVETVLEGFQELGVELVVSDPGNGATDKKMSDEDFVAAANKCDGLLAFFGKVRGNSPPRHHLLDLVKLPREKKAYVDGSEWSYTGWEHKSQAEASRTISPLFRKGEPWLNEPMLEKCGHYFKRECYPIDVECGIKPLPFALCKRHILKPDAPRDIHLLCSFGHVKTGLRKEALEVVERFKQEVGPNVCVVTKSGMDAKEYVNTLWRSRIVVDAWGGGDTTDRFWEAIGGGACVLYQRHNVVTSNPFTDWHNAVSWSDEAELHCALRRLTTHPDEAEAIGLRGLEHALRFHTARHRAEEILRVFER